MKTFLSVAIATLFLAASARADETISAGPFSVDVTPALAVRCNGKTVFCGDRVAAFRGLLPNPRLLVDTTQGRIVRKGNVITLLSEKGRDHFRREISVTADAVEITFEIQAFGEIGGSHLEYDLAAPPELLDGQMCEATTGAPRATHITKPISFDMQSMKAREYLVTSLVYLSVPGIPCTLDFNPAGAWVNEGNYGDVYDFTPWHDGKLYYFIALCSGAQDGATMTGKVVIRPGAAPYDQFHDRRPVSYTTDFPVVLALNFSEKQGDERYQACPAVVPADKPYRWQTPSSVRIVTRKEGGLLYRDFAAPADEGGAAALELEQRSGLYLLTLNVCDMEEATGPFDVTGPDGPLFKNVRLKPGEHWVKTAAVRFRDGKAVVRFGGKWKVNALALQAILYEPEDFLFWRGFWNMEVAASQPAAAQ